HPVQPAPANDQVRIAIKVQERGDRVHPFPDLTAHHDPTLVRDIARQQEVYVTEVPGKQVLPPEAPNGDAAGAIVARVNIIFALRIVELRRTSFDYDIAVGLFPIINTRLADVGTTDRNRWNVS